MLLVLSKATLQSCSPIFADKHFELIMLLAVFSFRPFGIKIRINVFWAVKPTIDFGGWNVIGSGYPSLSIDYVLSKIIYALDTISFIKSIDT